MFFSSVRSKGGYNNNPSCRSFVSIFKQLLIHADIASSEKGNCSLLDDTSLLKISEAILNRPKMKPKIQILTDTDKVWILSENDRVANLYVHDTIGYIAGFISRKIMKISKCEYCPKYLIYNDAFESNSDNSFNFSNLIYIKNRGNLKIPSLDLVNICNLAEEVFKSFYNGKKSIFKQLVDSSARRPDFRHSPNSLSPLSTRNCNSARKLPWFVEFC